MLTALVIGLIGSSALVLGAGVGAVWTAPERVTGVLLAFASGTLIAALAFELFPEAVEVGGLAPSALGLFSGAVVFVVVNTIVDGRIARGAGDADEAAVPLVASETMEGAEAEQSDKVEHAAAGRGAARSGLGIAFGLLAAVTLDGVPENLALGVSLGGAGGSLSGVLALLVAVFVSNLPESLVGSMAMRAGGQSRRFVVTIWGSSHLSGEQRVRMRGGEGRSGQVTPPVWSRTRSR